MGRTKFVFNRREFSQQVLKSHAIQRKCHEGLEAASVGRSYVFVRDQTQGKTRNGAVAITNAGNRGVLQEILANTRVT